MFCTDKIKSKEFSASNSTDFKVINHPASEQRIECSHKGRKWEEERLRTHKKIPYFLFTGFGLDLTSFTNAPIKY